MGIQLLQESLLLLLSMLFLHDVFAAAVDPAVPAVVCLPAATVIPAVSSIHAVGGVSAVAGVLLMLESC